MLRDIPEVKHGWIYWKLAIWKILFGSFKTAGTFYIGATASVRFVDLHADQMVLVILSMLLAVTTFIDGFIDQTVGRLLSGRPPIKLPTNDEDTNSFEKKKMPS